MPTKPKQKKRYRYIAQVVVETDEPVTKRLVRQVVEAAIQYGKDNHSQRSLVGRARYVVRREVDIQ